MKCENCIHKGICSSYELYEEIEYRPIIDNCSHFQDKDKVIELPCKVGDTVYEVQEDRTIQKWFVYGIIKYDGQEWTLKAKNNKNKWKYIDKTFAFRIFGKTVFLTKEEAEKALKELKE